MFCCLALLMVAPRLAKVADEISILLPLDILFPGDWMSHVDITQLLNCLLIIFITTIAISGQLYQVPERRRFIDPDALIVIALVFISLFLLFVMRDSGAAM